MLGNTKCTLSNVSFRPLLYVLLLGLSLASSLLTPALTANAASAYDNSYQTTDNIYVDYPLDGGICQKTDLSLDWAKYINDSQYWSTDLSSAKASFNSAVANVDNGGSWGVSMRSEGANNEVKYVMIYWNETPIELQWNTSTVYSLSTKQVRIQCSNTNTITAGDYQTATAIYSNASRSAVNYFITNANPNYPDPGYAGQPITDTPTLPSTDPDVYPKIVYSVDDKNFVGIYMRNLAGDGSTINNPDDQLNYNIHWRIYDRDNSDTILADKIDFPAAPFNYTFKEFGEYKLSVWYEPPNLPPPALPGELPTGYNYHTLNIKIKIDGNTYTSSDLKQECDDTGQNCSSVTAYEDCTTYGSDVGGYIACIVRNTGKKLFSWINLNLIPRASTVSTSFIKAGEKITNSGGLASIIMQPLASIASLTTAGCTNLNVPLPFADRNLVMPCMTPIYQDKFGAAFTLYQTITTGLVAYYVILGMFATVKGLKDPQNDKIEAVNL